MNDLRLRKNEGPNALSLGIDRWMLGKKVKLIHESDTHINIELLEDTIGAMKKGDTATLEKQTFYVGE